MKGSKGLILMLLIAAGCSKVTVENSELPPLEGLTPATIETELPVFNLTVDDEEFEEMIGWPDGPIYIKTLMEYRDENGQQVLENVAAQMEIKGRSSAFKKMKSLGLIFDDPLNNHQNKVIDPVQTISGHSLQTLEAIRFRNSGNDFGLTMVKDISYTGLAVQAQLDFEIMYYRPAHVFVNSHYYGLMNLRTENNRKGMAGLRSVDFKTVTVIQIDADNGNLEWDEGPLEPANKFVQALEQQDAEALWPMIDESSFIDYIIFQDYIGNFDWPHNNTRMYTIEGSRFRFVLYDLDFAAFNTKNALLPELEYRDDDFSELYRQMRKKPGFDERLKARQKQLYKFFSPATFDAIVDRNAEKIKDEIPYFIARYGEPQSLLHWHMHLDFLKREFYSRDKHIREKYDL